MEDNLIYAVKFHINISLSISNNALLIPKDVNKFTPSVIQNYWFESLNTNCFKLTRVQ